jgi:hypothetical protein
MEAERHEFDAMPDWLPLELAVDREQLGDFMHMGKVGSIQLYKHRNTRRYLNIDSNTGECFQYVGGEYRSVERHVAIAYSFNNTMEDAWKSR